jgi:hypothetical protein
MAKATLEFDLNEPDDIKSHLRAIKSTDLVLSLWDMDGYLRGQTKHAPDSMSPEVYNTLQNVRDKLYEIMSKYSIDLDELIS